MVYSSLRTKDLYLAQSSFGSILRSQFCRSGSQVCRGSERDSGNRRPLTQAHPALAEKLRTSTPGLLQQPFKLTDWWLVLRLERYTPASFDERMAAQLSQELFNQWVNEEASRKMAALFGSGAATTAA